MTVKVYSPILPSVELFGAYAGVVSATTVNQTVSFTFTPTEGTVFVVPYGNTVSEVQLEEGSTATPYQLVGADVVTNGAFETDTGWTKGTGWTISSGKAICNGTDATEIVQPGVVGNQAYEFSYEVVSSVSGTLQAVFGDLTETIPSSVGSHTVILFSPQSGSLGFRSNSFNGALDNVSVVGLGPVQLPVKIYPSLRSAVTTSDTMKTGSAVFFNYYRDVSNLRGLTFTDGILSSVGTVNLVEAIT